MSDNIPEGPAQEPEWTRPPLKKAVPATPVPAHQWEPDFSEGEPPRDSKLCGLCGKEHPATPAPSQPVEAQEWLPQFIRRHHQAFVGHEELIGYKHVAFIHMLLDEFAAQQTAAFELKGWQDAIQSVRASLQQYPNVGGDIEIMQAVEKIVQEQTAAKDAEIERLHMDESPELAQVKSALATEYELRQAAERGRDSLRVERDNLKLIAQEQQKRAVRAEILLSALNAGKDGQK